MMFLSNQHDDNVGRKLGSLAILSNDLMLTAPTDLNDSDWALITLDNPQYHRNNESHRIGGKEWPMQIAKQMPLERRSVTVRSGSVQSVSAMSIRAAGLIHIPGHRGVHRVWRINLDGTRKDHEFLRCKDQAR